MTVSGENELDVGAGLIGGTDNLFWLHGVNSGGLTGCFINDPAIKEVEIKELRVLRRSKLRIRRIEG